VQNRGDAIGAVSDKERLARRHGPGESGREVNQAGGVEHTSAGFAGRIPNACVGKNLAAQNLFWLVRANSRLRHNGGYKPPLALILLMNFRASPPCAGELIF
jgi:hypothetical protein